MVDFQEETARLLKDNLIDDAISLLLKKGANFKKEHNFAELSEAYYHLGYIYDWNLCEFEKAINYYKKSILLKNRHNLSEKAKIYFRLSVVQYYQNLLDEAKRNVELAIREAQKEEDNKTLGKAYNILGDILDNDKEAEESYLLSHKLLKKQDDIHSYAHVKTSIAIFYAEAGNFKKALKFIDEANKLAQKINEIGITGTVLLGYGIVYFHKGDYSRSKNYFEKGIALVHKAGAGLKIMVNSFEKWIEKVNAKINPH